MSMLRNYLKIWILAGAGGCLFRLIHMPLPWMLGPLVTVAVAKNFFSQRFPRLIPVKQLMPLTMRIRRAALLVLGYALGSAFTPQTGQYLLTHLPAITGLTLVTIAICLLGGYAAGRIAGVGTITGLLGSMPGGIIQMLSIAKNVREADTSAVIMMQTVRTVTVVVLVPLIVTHGLAGQVYPVNQAALPAHSGEIPALLLFAGVIAGATYLAEVLKITGSYIIIAPVIGTAALVLAGIDAPPLPPWLLLVAQIGFGMPIGMIISIHRLASWKKTVAYTFASMIMVISALLGVSYFYSRYFPPDIATLFISTAPGGFSEMGLTAMAVQADLATVVAFQLFRFIFVMLVVMPVIRRWLSRRRKDGTGAGQRT